MLTNIAAPDFDLEKTLDSGQVFHWQKIGNAFWGAIAELPLCVEQQTDTLKIRAAGRKLDGLKPSSSKRDGNVEARRDLERLVANYFALDHPLAKICRAFPSDPAMTAARDFCAGLRIIRQPLWECLATFIASSMKQVAHIRQISHTLRTRYGEGLQLFDRKVQPSTMEFAVRRIIACAPLRVARGGRQGRQLRDALRLRTAARVSDRCLD